MLRRLSALFLLLVAAVLAAGGWLYWFSTHALALPSDPFEFTVRQGAGIAVIARQLTDAGALMEPWSLRVLARVQERAPIVQAGTYRIEGSITPVQLLDKLARGDVVMVEMRFVEGSTLRQWLAQLALEPRVKHTAAGANEAGVRAALELGERSPEGWLFPDTYRFAPGVADAEILKRAHAAMKRRLDAAWEAREPGLPLKDPYEALILASIVEKETGSASERPLVASVFVNRIRKGMRLQTDPTVIYGIGEKFDGNIRKRDLTTDTAYNTYTRDGLPPTPIAMPGAASLQAVSRPATSEYLYFVGKGDATHQFSRTLEEHNRAVAKFQLKK
jgi:UPF0755 protein